MADPKPLRADAERNRRLILDAAQRAFAERGLGVRLDEVAEEAGVGVGTVYRRFKDKDELVRALFEEALGEVVELAEHALEQPGGTGLRWFFEHALTRMAEDRALQQIITGTPTTAADFAAVARAQIEPRVAELARRAHAAGTLRADIQHTDLPIVQVLSSAAMDATVPLGPDAWRRYVTLLLDALEPRPGDRPLPGRAPEPDQVVEVMQHWRPPPRRAGARQ